MWSAADFQQRLKDSRSDCPLTGPVAIVNGASSGVGGAIARRLAEHGASVAVVARRKDRLDALVNSIAELCAMPTSQA